MKPLVKYRGGKSKEIPYLTQYVPAFTGRYIEPFVGGGALFFHLQPKRAIINDINKKLMTFYGGVKHDFDELTKELFEVESIYRTNRKIFEKLKQHDPTVRVDDPNEQFYYRMRDMFNGLVDKKYSDALLYFFINKTSYSGMIRHNSKGEFNVPYGRYANLNASLVTKDHHQLLASTEIHNFDYRKILDMAMPEDFIFLDPPYDCVFSDYGNAEYKDGFLEKDHVDLAAAYKQLECKALMVIGKTPLTEKLYGNMIVCEYGKSYSVNIRNRFKSTASHILISNYGDVSANFTLT